jgi:hypothetical protein
LNLNTDWLSCLGEPKWSEMIRQNRDSVLTPIGMDMRTGERGFESQMTKLVGFYARNRHPELTTMEAYDVAGKKLYDALPRCRNCGCL